MRFSRFPRQALRGHRLVLFPGSSARILEPHNLQAGPSLPVSGLNAVIIPNIQKRWTSSLDGVVKVSVKGLEIEKEKDESEESNQGGEEKSRWKKFTDGLGKEDKGRIFAALISAFAALCVDGLVKEKELQERVDKADAELTKDFYASIEEVAALLENPATHVRFARITSKDDLEAIEKAKIMDVKFTRYLSRSEQLQDSILSRMGLYHSSKTMIINLLSIFFNPDLKTQEQLNLINLRRYYVYVDLARRINTAYMHHIEGRVEEINKVLGKIEVVPTPNSPKQNAAMPNSSIDYTKARPAYGVGLPVHYLNPFTWLAGAIGVPTPYYKVYQGYSMYDLDMQDLTTMCKKQRDAIYGPAISGKIALLMLSMYALLGATAKKQAYFSSDPNTHDQYLDAADGFYTKALNPRFVPLLNPGQVKSSGINKSIMLSQAYLYLQQSKTSDAEKAFKKVLEIAPNQSYALVGMALALVQEARGKSGADKRKLLDDALVYCNKAIMFSNNTIEKRHHLERKADVHMLREEFYQANELYDLIEEMLPDEIEVKASRGNVLLNSLSSMFGFSYKGSLDSILIGQGLTKKIDRDANRTYHRLFAQIVSHEQGWFGIYSWLKYFESFSLVHYPGCLVERERLIRDAKAANNGLYFFQTINGNTKQCDKREDHIKELEKGPRNFLYRWRYGKANPLDHYYDTAGNSAHEEKVDNSLSHSLYRWCFEP